MTRLPKVPDDQIELPFLRTPYNYDRNKASDESGLRCEDKSLTKQAFAEECDINEIVRRFGLTGQLPNNLAAPTHGDFTGLNDYHSAMNAIRKASEAFMEMPAHIRARFHNDPAELVDFCSDENNRAEAEKLGLVLPGKTPPTTTGDETQPPAPKKQGQKPPQAPKTPPEGIDT